MSVTGMTMLALSSCIYFVETDYNDQDAFNSIPDAFWYTLVTLTTVGYGDAYPITGWGKVVGAVTVVCGVVIFSMQIAVMGSNYEKAVKMEEMRRLCKDLRRGLANDDDGQLTPQELKTILMNSQRGHLYKWGNIQKELMGHIEGLFQLYDKDHSGSLDHREIEALLRDLEG